MKLKLISVLLVLTLCIGCFAGCGGKGTDTPEETVAPAEPVQTEAPADEAEEGADEEAEESADAAAARMRREKYQAAYEKYDPDTVVMTVNGQEIVWREFFSWLYDIMYQLEDSYGVTDWSELLPGLVGDPEDTSFGNYAFSYAGTNALQIAVINAKAAELGVDLDEAQEADLDSKMQSYYDYFGSEEEFRERIATAFLDADYFRVQNRAMTNYSNLFEYYYGENGADCPDEDVRNYLTDQGYMHAKHILFSTLDGERNPLPDEEIATQRAKAEEVLAKLKACSAAELAATFDELAAEYNEDPGQISYPGGYYFLPGEMVAEFEAAAAALNENEISDIVESFYGYHILFCPPMNADDTVGYDADYSPYTARLMASSALFSNIVSEWFDSAEVIPNEFFVKPDVNALFAS